MSGSRAVTLRCLEGLDVGGGVLIRLSIVEKDRAKGSSDCKAKVTQRFISPHQVQAAASEWQVHPEEGRPEKSLLPSWGFWRVETMKPSKELHCKSVSLGRQGLNISMFDNFETAAFTMTPQPAASLLYSFSCKHGGNEVQRSPLALVGSYQ